MPWHECQKFDEDVNNDCPDWSNLLTLILYNRGVFDQPNSHSQFGSKKCELKDNVKCDWNFHTLLIQQNYENILFIRLEIGGPSNGHCK